ncbi:hypothetical protein EDB19DRAFT_1801289, partial [Suillus lakei]
MYCPSCLLILGVWHNIMFLATVLNSFTTMAIPSPCSRLCISSPISSPISCHRISCRRISCRISSPSRTRSTLPMSCSRSDFEAICIYFFVPSTRTGRNSKQRVL